MFALFNDYIELWRNLLISSFVPSAPLHARLSMSLTEINKR